MGREVQSVLAGTTCPIELPLSLAAAKIHVCLLIELWHGQEPHLVSTLALLRTNMQFLPCRNTNRCRRNGLQCISQGLHRTRWLAHLLQRSGLPDTQRQVLHIQHEVLRLKVMM